MQRIKTLIKTHEKKIVIGASVVVVTGLSILITKKIIETGDRYPNGYTMSEDAVETVTAALEQ